MNTYQRNILIGLGALTAVGIVAAIVGSANASPAAPSSGSGSGGDGSGTGGGEPGGGGVGGQGGQPPIQMKVIFNPDFYWTGQRKEEASEILLAVWQDLGSPDIMTDADAYLEVMNTAAKLIFPENLTADVPFVWPQTIAEQTKLIGTVGGKKRLGSVAWKGMRDILFAVTGSVNP